MAKVAGVPPDYFNDKGQLWNMPVYNWDLLRDKGFDWWVERVRKNLQLFNVVRLDHFRGFSSFWEVDGGSEDAIKGQWIQGPGRDLFETFKHHFPEMPFIAEDLGDIDQPVFDLRDRYHLPGRSYSSLHSEKICQIHLYTSSSS
jgi:4-alpha-glucanotransferase